jgi:ribosomal-protein-alanine N-acetyltransferase
VSVVERILRRDQGASTSTIRPMRRSDLRRGVLPIEQASYPRPWSSRVFRSELEQCRVGTRYYVVALRGGDVVGYAGLWFAVGEAHVTNVAVRPDVRRTGVARGLLLALAERAIARGCAAWTLEVRASSGGAQELYRAFGFAPAGVRPRYYENVDDAIVMWCHDIQTPAYRTRLDRLAVTP